MTTQRNNGGSNKRRNITFCDAPPSTSTVPSLDDYTNHELSCMFWTADEIQSIRFAAKRVAKHLQSKHAEEIEAIERVYLTTVKLGLEMLEQPADDDDFLSTVVDIDEWVNLYQPWCARGTARGVERYASAIHKQDRATFWEESRLVVIQLSQKYNATENEIYQRYRDFSQTSLLLARIAAQADAAVVEAERLQEQLKKGKDRAARRPRRTFSADGILNTLMPRPPSRSNSAEDLPPPRAALPPRSTSGEKIIPRGHNGIPLGSSGHQELPRDSNHLKKRPSLARSYSPMTLMKSIMKNTPKLNHSEPSIPIRRKTTGRKATATILPEPKPVGNNNNQDSSSSDQDDDDDASTVTTRPPSSELFIAAASVVNDSSSSLLAVDGGGQEQQQFTSTRICV